VKLNDQGVWTAHLCTVAFADMARDLAAEFGMPQLPIVVVDHPVAGASPERIGQLAGTAWEQLAAFLGSFGLLGAPE